MINPLAQILLKLLKIVEVLSNPPRIVPQTETFTRFICGSFGSACSKSENCPPVPLLQILIVNCGSISCTEPPTSLKPEKCYKNRQWRYLKHVISRENPMPTMPHRFDVFWEGESQHTSTSEAKGSPKGIELDRFLGFEIAKKPWSVL